MAKKLGHVSRVATKVKIGQLRDRMSYYVRRAAGGETIIVLNRDREVAVLAPLPHEASRRRGFHGFLRGTAKVVGDIVEPGVAADAWFRS